MRTFLGWTAALLAVVLSHFPRSRRLALGLALVAMRRRK
jgi:hypothetical protein